MPVICPAILAADAEQFNWQLYKVSSFAHRIQIDVTDGVFAESKTIKPAEATWPVGIKVDFHLMYKRPNTVLKDVLAHQPHMVIIHAESEGDFEELADTCHHFGVKVGVALLPETPVESILPAFPKIDHVLIFSGSLGRFGGQANLSLLNKVAVIKQNKPSMEIGWDGGVSQNNVSQLVFGGIDVLNAGGFIQNAADPQQAYKTLERIADETGTT